MPALPELQQAFYAGMLDPQTAEPALLATLQEDEAVGRRRLAAYRRTVIGTLSGALLATYPVVARIVGEPFFREAARSFVLSHPSCSGDLNEYGEDFADFLADYPHARELRYLPDVARLEWLMQTVYYAADARPTDLAALAAADPSRWGEIRFDLAPARARLDSPHPLHEIWRVNAEGYDGDMTVDFSRDSRLLVFRRQGLVEVRPLGAGAAVFFDAIAGGDDLAHATAAVLALDAAFDPAPELQALVGDGVIVAAVPPETA
jgi:hypothetical protein